MGISKWNAGIIRPVPVAPAGPYQNSSAPGVWTVDQQAYWQKQGLWPTPGNIDPSSFIENLFSTYLYTGNDGTLPIVNGIDLATYGGMTWLKSRTYGSGGNHQITDTARGINAIIKPNLTDATSTASGDNLVSFNTTGFTLGSGFSGYSNFSGSNNVVWTFREQPKFFDIVTYTGTGSNTTIAHSLGAIPGCIIVKRTDTSQAWAVYHRSLANTQYLVLNTTAAVATGATWWNSTTPTSTVFSVGTDASVNASGGTYVAYIYAHDAGGFGLTGTDNVISCGSYTGTGADNNAITLGFEPQFLMIKRATGGVGDWLMADVMRGIATPTAYDTPATVYSLSANTSAAEAFAFTFGVTSTGFNLRESNSQLNASGDTYIYIAIRRGPMAVPTLGTSVFNALSRTGTAATATVSTTILPDLVMSQARSGLYNVFYDRLRGAGATLSPNLGSDAESSVANGISAFNNTSYTVGTDASQNRINWNTYTYANWLFSRAPGFFDEVCYTGTGSAQNVTHNLTVAPELVIIKSRSGGGGGYSWIVGSSTLPSWGRYLQLNEVDAVNGSNNAGPFNNTAPTSSVLTVNTWTETNGSGSTYVAYLFATCAGVSKVGSYTGTGALQTVACGFTSGARLVLIKRTDSTGDWYIWDSARGITAGNDPYLLLNSTAAEVTGTNYVDTDTTGFKVTAAAPAALNAVGGNYIFLAIA